VQLERAQWRSAVEDQHFEPTGLVDMLPFPVGRDNLASGATPHEIHSLCLAACTGKAGWVREAELSAAWIGRRTCVVRCSEKHVLQSGLGAAASGALACDARTAHVQLAHAAEAFFVENLRDVRYGPRQMGQWRSRQIRRHHRLSTADRLFRPPKGFKRAINHKLLAATLTTIAFFPLIDQ
jgi:hypothetical protein